MNTDPWKARVTRHESRTVAVDDLEKALAVLRLCLDKTQAILQREAVPDEAVFRASHATAQVTNAIGKLVDAIELDTRLKEVETRLDYARKPRLVQNRA